MPKATTLEVPSDGATCQERVGEHVAPFWSATRAALGRRGFGTFGPEIVVGGTPSEDGLIPDLAWGRVPVALPDRIR